MVKARSKPTDAEQVNEWMDNVDASFKPSINAVRKIIKTAGLKFNERIKWNAPGYYYNEDIVTFGPTKAKDKIILVFHPAIVKIRSELLRGKLQGYEISLSEFQEGDQRCSKRAGKNNQGIRRYDR